MSLSLSQSLLKFVSSNCIIFNNDLASFDRSYNFFFGINLMVDIKGSDDINNACKRSSFVFILEFFLVWCCLYIL